MAQRAMRSRVWSCSELEKGNDRLLGAVKQEPHVCSPKKCLDDELEKAPLGLERNETFLPSQPRLELHLCVFGAKFSKLRHQEFIKHLFSLGQEPSK